MINEANINCYSIKTEGKYECDAIFVLDDELFILECKTHFQPYTIREHVNFENQILKEVNQFNINADFYESNIYYIIKRQKLNKNWSPIRVHRIFLTSVMLGEYKFINNCHITDIYILTRFFKRNKPSPNIKFGNKQYKKNIDYCELEGKVTAEKFLNYIKNSYEIELMSFYSKPANKFITINEYQIQMPYYENFCPHLSFVESTKPEQEIEKEIKGFLEKNFNL